MKKIGIIIKRRDPKAAQAASALIQWLRQAGHRVQYDCEARGVVRRAGGVSKETLVEGADLLVVLGGDGTMLAAARLEGGRGIPILACNMGGLGFLAESTLEDLYPNLQSFLEGKAEIDERMTLKVQAVVKGLRRKVYRVLNDVVVAKSSIARLVNLTVCIDGRQINRYRGDGVIVATPTGSTAYSLAAGGPLVVPSHQSIIVTPLAPHSLTNRTILFPPEITLEICSVPHGAEVFVTLDGQEGFPLPDGMRIEVSRHPDPVLLIKNASRDFYDVLRSKLRWGDQ